MRNLLPGRRKDVKAERMLREIRTVRPPIVPTDAMVERMRLYDDFSKPLPKLKLSKDTNNLLLTRVDTLERDHENWLNYCALYFMQISMVEVEEPTFDPKWTPLQIRNAGYSHADAFSLEVEAWEVKTLGQTGEPEEEEEEPEEHDDEGDYPNEPLFAEEELP